jgi:hypothetical protein
VCAARWTTRSYPLTKLSRYEGPCGEGVTYNTGSMQIFEAAMPFLNNKDKAGRLTFKLRSE